MAESSNLKSCPICKEDIDLDNGDDILCFWIFCLKLGMDIAQSLYYYNKLKKITFENFVLVPH